MDRIQIRKLVGDQNDTRIPVSNFCGLLFRKSAWSSLRLSHIRNRSSESGRLPNFDECNPKQGEKPEPPVENRQTRKANVGFIGYDTNFEIMSESRRSK
ncbi:hypothetical protein [Methylomagnum sp.]